MKKFFQVLISILICQSAGIIGSAFTFSAIPTWYVTLNKPSFTPPNWVFGPVWLALYTLMGIAVFLVWDKARKKKEGRTALKIFAVQLLLNTLWSIVFFGYQQTLLALFNIIILWFFILLTFKQFWPISRIASLFLTPYLLWVSLATSLNYFIYILNP